MAIEKREFGTVDNKRAHLYTLTNENGLIVRITDYGGIVTEVHAPDREGKLADVVLGFDSLDRYVAGHPYFGAIVGRVANRIANGKFTIDGIEYNLAINNGPNHLHGGIAGFDKAIWKSEAIDEADGPSLKLTHTSPDMDEGYPGNLDTEVIYTLTNDNELKVEMRAKTDKPTVVNLAHHSYWNLAGHDAGDVLDHVVEINARHYTPTDDTLIPTGEIRSVKGTPYDFTAPKAIGASLNDIPCNPEAGDPGGYDINFVLDGKPGELKLASRTREPRSGRVMEVYTTEPGVQFYTGNFLDGTDKGKGNTPYEKQHAFCFETQHFPDAINKPEFPTTLVKPGEEYHHLMIHRFSAE